MNWLAAVFGWVVSAWLLYLAGLAALGVLVGTSESTRHLSRARRLAWLILFACAGRDCTGRVSNLGMAAAA